MSMNDSINVFRIDLSVREILQHILEKHGLRSLLSHVIALLPATGEEYLVTLRANLEKALTEYDARYDDEQP